MAKVSVYDITGKQVSETELNDEIFGITPNEAVMHAMVVNYLANQRQGTQSTGHARQGSTRAPQWVHGGIALGPKPRDYRYTLNKKVRRLAMKSALSSKVIDNNIIVLDALTLDSYKTKPIADMLKALGVQGKALIVTAEADAKVVKSAANIPGVKTAAVNTLNVYDILTHRVLVVDKAALQKIEEVYA